MPVLDGFRNLKAACTETARSQRICAKIGWLTPASEGGGKRGEDVEPPPLRRVQGAQVVEQRHGLSPCRPRPHEPVAGVWANRAEGRPSLTCCSTGITYRHAYRLASHGDPCPGLASLKTPGASEIPSWDNRIARCRQSSQLGQLLGVRHKDADLGDGVGAVAVGQQPGPVRGLGGALVPDGPQQLQHIPDRIFFTARPPRASSPSRRPAR